MAAHSSLLAWRIPVDRGAWWATVHGVTKSRTRLKQLSIHTWAMCALVYTGAFSGQVLLSRDTRALFIQYQRHQLCIRKPFFKSFSPSSWPKSLVSLVLLYLSDQIRSVAQLCPTLCDTMNRSTPGLPVHHHQLPEFTQTHVHRVSDAIQPSHPLSSPSPPATNPSQNQGLFQ